MVLCNTLCTNCKKEKTCDTKFLFITARQLVNMNIPEMIKEDSKIHVDVKCSGYEGVKP